MSIPIVIVHIGNSYYEDVVVEFNANKNPVDSSGPMITLI
jgi:hypothetical protein